MIALSPSSSVQHVLVPTGAGERGDVLVHALAQLPDSVTGELAGRGPRRAELELLVRAYGLEDRVGVSSTSAPAQALPVPPSAVADGSATMAELVESLAPDGGIAASARGDDDVLAGERIVLVTNLPVHYRLPLFAGLARRLAAAGASFEVVFAAERDPGRDWLVTGSGLEFEHSFLRGRLGLERTLARLLPTLVLAPGFSPRALRVARWAVAHRVDFGLWSGEIPATAAERSRIRRLSRGAVIRRARFAIAYGSLAGEYVRALAPGLPLVHGRNASPLPAPASGSRGPTVELLAVSRAIPGKGLELLVDAAGQLRDLDCRLTIVGDGPELASLTARAAELDTVRFTGALAPHEVRELHAAADVSAFPSRIDVFGLALYEAMGIGLPAVASPQPGAVADLAVRGRNCVVVDERESGAWAAALRRLVLDRELRRAVGAAAARTVASRWTMDHSIDAWTAGLRLGVLGRAR